MLPAAVTLRPEPASVRNARRFVAQRLAETGFDGAVFVAELLVSELVTNAVLHARTELRVAVEPRGQRVRVTVTDASSRGVRRRRHSVESGTGRGLMLVDRMAERWGVDLAGEGKSVWFELPPEPEVDDADMFDVR